MRVPRFLIVSVLLVYTNLFSCDITMQAGIYPTLWQERSTLYVVNPALAPASLLVPQGDIPQFNNLFAMPFIVGVHCGYFFLSHLKGALEGNYIYAPARDIAARLSAPSMGALRLSSYQIYSGYVASSYYFDSHWHDFFCALGGKIGFLHHVATHFKSLALTTTLADYPRNTFFTSNTTVSAGAFVALEWVCSSQWLIRLKGEAIISGGPCATSVITLSDLDAVVLDGTTLLPAAAAREFSFPLTLGIEYMF